MPDWLTHTLFGWIIGKTTKIEVGLVVIGSLLPDISKLNQLTIWLGADYGNLLNPFHTPFFALLIGAIIALFFENSKLAFITLVIGIITHFVLDFFLIGITNGIQFLYPFNLDYWRFNLIVADFHITLITVITAIGVYIFYFYKKRKKYQTSTNILILY